MTTSTPTLPQHHASHALERPGAWKRYRDAYSKLPPGLQLIGLQLWLPVFFTIVFCFCYVLAFHAPTPTDVPVAVVGSGTTTSQFAAELQSSSKGVLAVGTVSTLADARAKVRDSDLVAAYVPGSATAPATLVVNSAAQYQMATLVKTVFEPVALAEKATLTVDDVAPLPAHDSFGTSLFYQTLVWSIGGYMVGMFVGMFGNALQRRTRWAVLAGAAIVLPFISLIITHFVIGAVGGDFFALWAIGSATAYAIGLCVNGLAYFLGRFVTGAALLLFVFLNIPAAGGAYAPELVPQPFKFLHSFVSGTGTLTLLRREIYGVGPASWHGWLILACYAAAGILLALVGKPYVARRIRLRAARGADAPMMANAQAAASALNRPVTEKKRRFETADEMKARHRREEEEREEAEAEAAAAETETGAIAAITGEA